MEEDKAKLSGESFLQHALAKLQRAGFSATQDADQALAVGEDNLRTALRLLQRSSIEEQSEKYESALNLIDQAADIAPGLAGVWARKARVLQAIGQTEDAINNYERALAIDPSDGATWFNKATVYINSYGLIGSGAFNVASTDASSEKVLSAFDEALSCLKRAESLGYSKATPVMEALAGFRQIADSTRKKQ